MHRQHPKIRYQRGLKMLKCSIPDSLRFPDACVLEGAGDLVSFVISRAIIRVTPFKALITYNSTHNLLTKSPAPSSSKPPKSSA